LDWIGVATVPDSAAPGAGTREAGLSDTIKIGVAFRNKGKE
jgi:hypothetical protein